MDVDKISSTKCQGIRKSRSRILMFAKLNAKKGNANDCHAIEKVKNVKNKYPLG